MPGDLLSAEWDPRYILARRVLLDALEALTGQLPAIILVGAQAIYLHTGEAEFAIAPFTADADLAIDPARLAAVPELERAMREAGFVSTDQPGIWRSGTDGVPVDLLVPAAVGGANKRRSADLAGHSAKVARKVPGLEAALVDHTQRTITALDSADPRAIAVSIAGPAALLIAKVYKLAERMTEPKRQKPKDAYDAYLLLLTSTTEDLAARLVMLRTDPIAGAVTHEALSALETLLGTEDAPGIRLLAQAIGPLADPSHIAASCVALTQDLIAALR